MFVLEYSHPFYPTLMVYQVRLTRLNHLFDRWVDPIIMGIRCEQVYQVLVKTDTCSNHSLEKYRTQLHIPPTTTTNHSNQNSGRILSRGAFLSMFQNERNHVILSMISLVEKYRRKKKLKVPSQVPMKHITNKIEPPSTLLKPESHFKPSHLTLESKVDDLIITREYDKHKALESHEKVQRPRASTEYHYSSRNSLPSSSNNKLAEEYQGKLLEQSHSRKPKNRMKGKTNTESDTDSTCPSTQSNDDSLSSISMYSTTKPYPSLTEDSFSSFSMYSKPCSSLTTGTSSEHPVFLQQDKRAVSNPEERLYRSDRRGSGSSSSRNSRSKNSESKLSLYSSQGYSTRQAYPKYRPVPGDHDLDDDCSCLMLDGLVKFLKDLFSSRPQYKAPFDWSKMER
jgi:hypothetical protein